MSDAFAAMLQPLYAKLGVAAQYTPAGGGAAAVRQVILDTGVFEAGGGLLTQEPVLRAMAADYPNGIARDSVFRVAEADYVVRTAAPLAPDGAELQVAVARLS